MDNDRLIELVKERECLYDPKHAKYNDKELKLILWDEIGSQLDCSPGMCRARWTAIRDNYRKFLRKVTKGQTITGQAVRNYKYARSMAFLKKHLFATKSQDLSLSALINEMQNNDSASEEHSNHYDSIEDPSNLSHGCRKQEIKYLDGHGIEDSSNLSHGCRKQEIKYLDGHVRSLTMSEAAMDAVVDAFLAGIAPTLKGLTPYYLNLAKSEIFQAAQKYEMMMLTKEMLNKDGEVECTEYSVSENY